MGASLCLSSTIGTAGTACGSNLWCHILVSKTLAKINAPSSLNSSYKKLSWYVFVRSSSNFLRWLYLSSNFVTQRNFSSLSGKSISNVVLLFSQLYPYASGYIKRICLNVAKSNCFPFVFSMDFFSSSKVQEFYLRHYFKKFRELSRHFKISSTFL